MGILLAKYCERLYRLMRMPEFEKKKKSESQMMTEGCLLLTLFTIIGIVVLVFVIHLYNIWRGTK